MDGRVDEIGRFHLDDERGTTKSTPRSDSFSCEAKPRRKPDQVCECNDRAISPIPPNNKTSIISVLNRLVGRK